MDPIAEGASGLGLGDRVVVRYILSSVALLLIFVGAASCDDNRQFEKTVGRVLISGTDSTAIGTAFVAGKSKSIYTCSHVVVRDTLWFEGFESEYRYRMALRQNLPSYDVALLQRTAGSQREALEFGDFTRVHTGDIIKYVGWDIRVRRFIIWDAVVIAKGTALAPTGMSVDFLEFEGKAIPGYSGGPVLDRSGRVVAIIREAWQKTAPRSGTSIMINRAFSIELLRVIDSEVTTHSVRSAEEEASAPMDLPPR
ncbi:MAG: trypsin-like peptidase domain-containing protein [Candidatus Eisenbacteria bacterium]|nr:trypsin-like peptidase domain-containing protein [Candidatus Eisenbacteria bacterium]